MIITAIFVALTSILLTWQQYHFYKRDQRIRRRLERFALQPRGIVDSRYRPLTRQEAKALVFHLQYGTTPKSLEETVSKGASN